jgi:ParB-like chromosome segregation protein Spo0J
MARDVSDSDGCVYDKAHVLVTGAHRLEAARRLGWGHVEAFETDADEVQAELWEIAENLHRCDLSKDERDRQIRRYAELIGQSPQNAAFESERADGRGHRREGVASIIAKETGVSKDTVERALNPERVAAERARSKIDSDVKARAAKEVADMLAEHVPGEWWDALKANLYAAGAANIANEFTNATGQSLMDRRYGT